MAHRSITLEPGMIRRATRSGALGVLALAGLLSTACGVVMIATSEDHCEPRISFAYERVAREPQVFDGAPGYVRIVTAPWGWASVPGQRIETTGGKLTLPPGKH